jgi:hypothetical protein
LMLLPYAASATLDIRKLAEYCLDPTHPRGRHKARVFRDALGLTAADTNWLGHALLDGVRAAAAVELTSDMHGTRWRIDIPVSRHERRAVVRSLWIVRTGERAPRFVTCWVM